MKFILFVLFLTFTSCVQETVDQKAQRIASETIIVDGHIDVPYKVEEKWRDLSIDQDGMDFDFVKAKKGGINAPFMSIYVGAGHQGIEEGSSPKNHKADAFKKANHLIDLMEKLVVEHPTKFKIATSVKDVRSQFKNGLISLPLGMENGAPIEGSFEKLNHFYKRGIRYITLTHSKWNHICDSSYDEDKHWDGLSPFGEKLILEMNKLGILVDISHVSDAAFYDVLKLTKAPLFASHSSARHFTPGFERNMNDDMIKKLGENGGVIMINFGSSFVTEKANTYGDFWRAKRDSIMTLRKIDKENKEQLIAITNEVKAIYPYPYATTEEVVDHIDHVVKLAGINSVGLGSDYDGVGDSLPIGLKDASSYPNLIKELLKRGYSEVDIKKILGENALRVWEEVENISKKLSK